MPKEYLDCVAALRAEGKSEDEAQKTCSIAYYKKHGMTPQEAEKMAEDKHISVVLSAVELAELRNVEIVKTGDHVAMDGSKVTYSEADLDEMIKNASELKDTVKPPIVVSHADGDESAAINAATVGAPQVGWLDPASLVKKKNADGIISLFANFKDIAKGAVDKIGTDLKRVSAEIYKNYKAGEKEFGKAIRRVSFVPIPAIKDMQDVTQAHLVFGETPDQPTTWVTLSEAAPESKGKETTTMPDMDIQELAEQVTALSGTVTKMQEENKAKDDEIKRLQEENKASLTKLSEGEMRRKSEDINRFCKDLLKNGQISPAMWSTGLEKFMAHLDDSQVTKFGESAKAPELTPLQYMKRLLKSIPPGSIVRFGEIAKPKPEPEAIDEAAAKRKELISKYQESHPKMPYKDVVLAVSNEHPDLFVTAMEE